MNLENLGKNKVKLTFEIGPDRFEEGLKHAYNKNKGKMNIPGFRKGKAPRKIIEINYGKEIFFEDAINYVLPEAYDYAVLEYKLDVVSRPDFDVTDVSIENGVIVTAIVYIKPEVEVGNYKGVTYKKIDTAVLESEIEEEINVARDKNARLISISDRPIQSNDTVTIDFEGFIDDVAFDGGSGKDYDIIIGSHTFIDTFEDQLIGHNIADDVLVNVTFPENYPNNPELAGKPAVFKVEIKEIKVKELPEINDDFAQDVSEFDTLEEYKKSIEKKLEEKKVHEANENKEVQIMQAIINETTMEIPDVMYENQITQLVNEFGNRIRMQGLSIEMYLQYMGQTMEALRNMYRENAEKQVQGRLVLEKIGEIENFAITEEELDEEITRMAIGYRMEKERLLTVLRDNDKNALKADLKVKKALNYVVENSIEIE